MAAKRNLVLSNCASRRAGRSSVFHDPPVVSRRRRLIEELSINHADSYVAKRGGRLRRDDPTQRNDRVLPSRRQQCQKCRPTCGFGASINRLAARRVVPSSRDADTRGRLSMERHTTRVAFRTISSMVRRGLPDGSRDVP